MRNISRFLFSFIISLIIWLTLTYPINLQELTVGIILSFIAAIIVLPYMQIGVDFFSPIKQYKLLFFIVYYIYALILANIKIATVVLKPKLVIHPSIVTAKTKLKSTFGKVILANGITMTPGTLTIDMIGNTIFVHCVNIKDVSEKSVYANILKPFEKHIEGIFG
jgi:multicomponent Na+:H+ antiporter subunit E